MSTTTEQDRAALAPLQELNELLEAAGQDGGSPVGQAVQILLRFHAAGLRKLLDAVAERCGDDAVSAVADDAVVSGMLLLHDLHPLDLPARVEQALERVRPYLHQHKGNVELLGVAEDSVRLRLLGSCHGCPSSQATLKNLIEEAVLLAAPEITAIDVEPPQEQETGFVPVAAVQYNGCPLPTAGAA